MLYTDVPGHQAMHLARVHPAAGKVHSRVGRSNRDKMKQAVLMELKMEWDGIKGILEKVSHPDNYGWGVLEFKHHN